MEVLPLERHLLELKKKKKIDAQGFEPWQAMLIGFQVQPVPSASVH